MKTPQIIDELDKAIEYSKQAVNLLAKFKLDIYEKNMPLTAVWHQSSEDTVVEITRLAHDLQRKIERFVR